VIYALRRKGYIKLTTDQTYHWLEEEIWPEIQAMMHNDAYFKLWFKAHELAEILPPFGPIAQMVLDGYSTCQLSAIRRMCDRNSIGISLRRLLDLIRKEEPQWGKVVGSLSSRLDGECRELSSLATQYVAHNGNPAKRDWKEWRLTTNEIIKAQNVICTTAIVIERDILKITQRPHIISVPNFSEFEEVKRLIPQEKLVMLREFWDDHIRQINHWLEVPRLYTGPKGAT
jgi:hypothetical protein